MNFITGDIFVLQPSRQTLKAWEPFWDCVSILFEFQNSDVDEDHLEWRISWVAGIAILRAIGHVLVKIDGCASAKHKAEIDQLWTSWKSDRESNRIFWDFIEKERNNLLKTYAFGATLDRDDEGFFVKYEGGEDAFQLFREGVYWWRHQLMYLEERLR